MKKEANIKISFSLADYKAALERRLQDDRIKRMARNEAINAYWKHVYNK